MFVAEQFDPLFIDGDRAALDAENVEEVVVKALRFALFIMDVLPFLAERLGAAFDFVPTQSHAAPIVAPDAKRTDWGRQALRSEEHTSELQSLMRISYAVFCLKKKNTT